MDILDKQILELLVLLLYSKIPVQMGGVASLRECQKAVQDAQTKAGIRTEVDRKTVLRAAAHLSDAGKIAVWRVPLEMETAFVLAGTTLMIWCEGAAALRGPEEALAVFNGRQEALHASRLEAKTQLAMEAGRKRGFQHDAPLDEDAYTGQPRKSKRKKIRCVLTMLHFAFACLHHVSFPIIVLEL